MIGLTYHAYMIIMTLKQHLFVKLDFSYCIQPTAITCQHQAPHLEEIARNICQTLDQQMLLLHIFSVIFLKETQQMTITKLIVQELICVACKC